MLKKLLYAASFGLGLIGVMLLFGAGHHALVRPKSTHLFTPPVEYEWDTGDPRGSQSYVRPVVERYLENVPPGARVLDLGCGNGAMIGSFLDKQWKLVGLDISKSGIEQARKRWPGLQFEVGDATEDLTALGQFDAIYSTEVIEHIVLPRRFVQNCFRLLKPGGIVVLSTPYHGWLKNVAIAMLNDADEHYDPLFDWGHIKFWSANTLSRLLWEAGFDDVGYKGAGRVPYLWKSIVMRARKPKS